MTVTNLRFETTWSYPYPIATTGAGTALTVCIRRGDPYLAFLTQTTLADPVFYLQTFTGAVAHRHRSPVGYDTIDDMAWDPLRRVIWCCQGTQDVETILAFDPNNGQLTGTRVAALTASMPAPQGLACNGFFFVRGGGPTAELWSTGGQLLGTHEYAGRGITGLSAAPWSWCFCDKYNDQIVVIGPLGNELAVGSGVGASGGMEAISFDLPGYPDMAVTPQVWGPNGTVGAVGTINHPDTPWNPVPWGGRHRLYVANEIDQTIYAGYLTADP
ncbi:MAG: hypothetical protein U1E53_15985 [Dongiaceae bacterium]